jgi:uncharacterized protein with von Willebrand factor type A (vWA) domain
MTEASKISLLPVKPVTKFGVTDRAFGRLAKMDATAAPASVVESDLAGDTFATVYRDAATLDAAPDGREVNKTLLDWMRQSGQWNGLIDTARGDVMASLTASQVLWEYLRSDEATRDALDAQAQADAERQRAEDLQQGAQAAETAADALEQAGNRVDAAELRQQAQAQRQQAQDAAQQAQAAQQAANASAEKAAGSKMTTALMSAAVNEAQDKAEEMVAVGAGFGRGKGEVTMGNIGKAQDALRRLSPKVRHIAKLAGRFRGVGFEARRNLIKRGEEPADLEFTQDFARMFPTELAMLGQRTDPLNRLRVVQWAESGLAGWKLTEREKERGPFVGAVDVSGSMTGKDRREFTREEIGKAVALGVAQVAQAENRPYRLFSFSSGKDAILECDSTQGWPEHLTWADDALHGGTDFDMALANALAHLDAIGDDGHRADLLFVSDGDATVAPETAEAWAAFKTKTGARLIYVAVAGVGRGYDQLEKLADMVIDVEDLSVEAGDALAQEVSLLV